tara:strand:- start:522 stop:848 length:327 start_codon:yes stop_codon:yes gene_type:complete
MPDIITETNREAHEELRELVAKSDWKSCTTPKMREQKARWIAAEFYEGTTAYGRKLFASVPKLRKLIMELAPKKKNKAKHSSLCACKECDPDGIRHAFAASMGETWDY